MSKRFHILKTKKAEIGDEDLANTLNTFAPEEVNYTQGLYEEIELLLQTGKAEVRIGDQDLSSFSGLYFKSSTKSRSLAISLAMIAKRQHIHVVDSILAETFINVDKLVTMTVLALEEIPIPKTYYTASKHVNFERIQEFLGSGPLIMKAFSARKGEHNYVVKSQEEVDHILATDRQEKPFNDFIFQEFIPNTFDFRFGVIGGELRYAKKRIRPVDSETHLNNISLGADVELVSVEEFASLASTFTRIATIFKREVMGVDAIIDSEGTARIIEVNPSPAFRNDLSMLKHLHDYLKSL